jgi:hypothetical protein
LNFITPYNLKHHQFDLCVEKEKLKLEKLTSIFQIPCNISSFLHILTVNNHQNQILQFTDDQRNYLQSFKNIYFTNDDSQVIDENFPFNEQNTVIIIIPSQITLISNLESLFKVRKIHLCQSITSLGESCFRKCYKLKEINLENIISIDNYCFAYCKCLEKI